MESLPARMADRSVCIGPAKATVSYLKVGTIVTAPWVPVQMLSIPDTVFWLSCLSCLKRALNTA